MNRRMVQKLQIGFLGRQPPPAGVEIGIQRNRVPSGAAVVAPEGGFFRLAAEIHTILVIPQ